MHALLWCPLQAGASQRVQTVQLFMKLMVGFGRCTSQEWLYREEFESYEKEGVLQMHTAFSREQASELFRAVVRFMQQ